MAYIYKISNDINNKVYIGKTNQTIKERWHQHCSDSRDRVLYEKRPLYSAMNKYGIEHFKIEEIEKCPDDSAYEREKYWIEYYNSYNNGYNATLGGDGKNIYNHQEILNLLKANKSTNEISKIIGCCKDIVYEVAKNNDIDLAQKLAQENAEKLRKDIAQYDLEMNFIQVFDSAANAARWIFDQGKCLTYNSGVRGHIVDCANGKRKTAYKYIWRWI